MPTTVKHGFRTARTGLVVFLFLAQTLYGKKKQPWQIESVAVSPDGKTIAVETRQGDTAFICTVPVDTGVATRLTNAQSGEEVLPAFTRHRKHIAYTSWPDLHARPRIVIANWTDRMPMGGRPRTLPIFRRFFLVTERQSSSNGLSFSAAIRRSHSRTGVIGAFTRVTQTA